MFCFFVHSSRLGDSEDLPDIRVDAASPGPRVTFNIQDSVRITLYAIQLYALCHFITSSMRWVHLDRPELLPCFCVCVPQMTDVWKIGLF